MSIPSVLLSGVKNESQDQTITTDVLEPNVLNSSQAVFVIPKKGSVLDSKSALKLKVNWTQFDATNAANVGGKLFSGMLGLIKNARLYASGQLISRLDHAGEKIHLDNQFKNQEYKEQYCDVKHGSNTGFLIADDLANSGLNGAIINDDIVSSRTDAEPPVISTPNYMRIIGKTATATDGDNGMEMFLLLEEIFPMLKDLQLPVRFLKDEIRIEIDFETDNTKWIMSSPDPHTTTNVAQVTVTEAVMFLDYITYNDEVDAELASTLESTGVSIPFRETAIITTALPGTAGASVGIRSDVLIGQEGRAIMKIFVAKRYPNTLSGGLTNNVNSAYSLQGNCRSDALKNQKFNFVVNDLLIYDRDVENPKESYNYFSYAGEKQASCYPDAWEYNDTYATQSVTNDVLYTTNLGGTTDQRILGNALITGVVKDGIRGTQNWDSVDLSKYGKQLNPANAMRIGSTPIIYRLTRDTGTDVRDQGAVQLTVFVEYLRLFDLRAGELAVRDL